MLAYLKNTESNGTETKWVHGGANIADGLTKLGHHQMLRDFLETSTWCFVYDNSHTSAKKRKAKGINPLDPNADAEAVDTFETLAWQQLALAFPEFCNSSESD